MRNLHSINNLTERELANIWNLGSSEYLRHKLVRYEGIIYYVGYNDQEWFDIWEGSIYSAISLEKWNQAGRPMPDLKQIVDQEFPAEICNKREGNEVISFDDEL